MAAQRARAGGAAQAPSGQPYAVAADAGTSRRSGWKRDSQRTISSRASAELPTWQCCSPPSRAVKTLAVIEPAQTSSRIVRYASGPDPAENIWERLRKNTLANRLYGDYRAIVDARCQDWNDFVADPALVTSTTKRARAYVP
jgi:hypothetical protein